MTVFTINVKDPTRDHVRTWMEQRNYDFPVLWGERYHLESGVSAYPTTWVVDREGRIVFEVVGGTGHFSQEFGWRVESLSDE